MLIQKILEGIQTRLKTELSDIVGDRVFVMSSMEAMPKSYQYPYISIIYDGGNIEGKIAYGTSYHNVNIYIFQTIWNEEFIVNGTPDNADKNKGLAGILSEVQEKLNDYELPNIPNGRNFLSAVMSYFPTESWISDGKYSGSIGLKIKYGVENG